MKRKNNVLAIMSAKGGTGKTTTSANLAAALSSQFDRKVLVIDTNITTASLALHFGIDSPKVTIYDVLKKNFPIESSIFVYNDNLHIIPASLKSFDMEENKEIMSFPDKIRRLVNHYNILLSNIVSNYDLVILDSAPGFSFESAASMQVADGILFVTNPDYPSLIATAKAVSYAQIVNVPMGGLVLNKVTYKNYELNQEDIEKLVGAKVAEEIPSDNNIPESIAKGKPIVLYKPHSPASIAYKILAGNLVGENYNKTLLENIKLILKKIY